MRKIIFIAITLLVMNVSSINAQSVWGVRMGLSSYTETLKFSGLSFSGNALGIELGPVLYYSLNDNLYINSGAMLGIMMPEDNPELDRADFQNFYIDIPLYLGVRIPIGNDNISFFGQAGPYVGYWTSTDEATNEIMNPLQAGLGIMTGINIKRFKFEFGYKAGLTNLTSVKEGDTFNGVPLIESSSKLTSLFFGVSYVF